MNQAVGSKDVHGYGKQLVDNVSVVTELDKLQNELVRQQARVQQLQSEQAAALRHDQAQQVLLRRRERRYETVTGHIDDAIARGAHVTPALQKKSIERKSLQKEISRGIAAAARRQTSLDRLSSRLEAATHKVEVRGAHRDSLESRRRIFRHDVELDSLFALLKVGLVLLVTFVLKEYLGDARMAPVTFLERLATLPGRLRLTPALEIVTFDYNTRDPEVMALLSAHADAINARRLRTRSGRILRIAVDPAPPPYRPPPSAAARVNTKRRFER